jgi:hypothetical protein
LYRIRNFGLSAIKSGVETGGSLQHERPHRPGGRTPGGRILTQYRLYFLGDEGHITVSHEFEAEDDAVAIRVATAWLEGRGAELWTGRRKVYAWEAGR